MSLEETQRIANEIAGNDNVKEFLRNTSKVEQWERRMKTCLYGGQFLGFY